MTSVILSRMGTWQVGSVGAQVPNFAVTIRKKILFTRSVVVYEF